MYSDQYKKMSPNEFEAKYSKKERKMLDEWLDLLEAKDPKQPCILTGQKKRRLEGYIKDLLKVKNYQNQKDDAIIQNLLEAGIRSLFEV